MAVDMFIKLEGIDSESQDDSHKDWIDVLAWSWGASQSGSTHMGGGGGSGKADIQDVSFTHFIDSASPKLMQYLFSGKHVPKGELVIRKAGDKPLEYLKVQLEDVMITSLSTGGSGGEDRLTENVTLNFAKVNVIYTPQGKDGSGGAEIKAGWDIAANKTLV